MNFKQKYPYRLLTPGPVPLHPQVRNILSEPAIHHRTPEFEACFKNVGEKLKKAFATQETVFIHTSTGSGAMESALVNTFSPGEEVLCVNSGKFGERWGQMAEKHGLKVHQIKVPWGEAVRLEQISEMLSSHPKIKGVLCQACETSTATVHPIREIAQIIRAREQTIFLVDAITGIGAMPLEADAWGIDVMVGGSQKAFMLPAGLSFISLSQKAWKFCEASRLPKFYFDLQAEKKSVLKGEAHFSSAVPMIRALDFALDSLIGEQKKKTCQRIQDLAQVTRSAAEFFKLKVFSRAPSPSVTALLVPEGIDSQKLRDHIEQKYNLTLMGGQDQLKGKILRIGHLGYITNDDMTALFEILFLALNDFGAKLPEGDLAKALKVVKSGLLDDISH